MTRNGGGTDWRLDAVTTRTGVVIPVRATARRPEWRELPDAVREAIVTRAGSDVVLATSTGTGFTSGFASRLDLADGRAVFVKAASTESDQRVGWQITHSYREEIRKLRALPRDVPAPRLLWSFDEQIDAAGWVVLGLQPIDGRPPRRPWRTDELDLVCAQLDAMAPAVATAPAGLELGSYASDFAEIESWVARVLERDGPSDWLAQVTRLARLSYDVCSGTALAHLDLRDDNLLIDHDDRVWICDWNWPLVGAAWLDLVTVLLSASGDGIDADGVLATHPLTRRIDPEAIDAWLASLWLYFTTSREQAVPLHSPHIRDHQAWYAEVTADWLGRRIGCRPSAPGQ
jgi:hypothetical protein